MTMLKHAQPPRPTSAREGGFGPVFRANKKIAESEKKEQTAIPAAERRKKKKRKMQRNLPHT